MRKELLNSVVISNELARYGEINLSSTEWKLLLYIISRIKKHELRFVRETFTIRDFCEIMGVSTRSIVIKAIESLKEKSIRIKENDYMIFERLNVDKNLIIYKLDDEMKEHLLNLRNNMTIFRLGCIYNMKSKYTIRLYIFGASFIFSTYYNHTKKTLNQMVGVDLPKSELERRILTPSLREINNTTNIFLYFRFLDGVYHFAVKEKNEKQKVKYCVDEWKNQIEESKCLEEINEELFADIDFDKL